MFTRGIQILVFVLTSGPSIVDQAEALKYFIADLVDRFNETGESNAMTAASAKPDEIETLAVNHATVAEYCGQFESQGPGARTVGSRGTFRDLIKLIIENKDQVIEIINFFKDLFGASQTSTESLVPGQTSD